MNVRIGSNGVHPYMLTALAASESHHLSITGAVTAAVFAGDTAITTTPYLVPLPHIPLTPLPGVMVVRHRQRRSEIHHGPCRILASTQTVDDDCAIGLQGSTSACVPAANTPCILSMFPSISPKYMPHLRGMGGGTPQATSEVHGVLATGAHVNRSSLGVPEQRILGSSGVLNNGLVFQHELRRVPEPSNVLVAHPVRIGSATLLGARSSKDWERDTIGMADQLEREVMF